MYIYIYIYIIIIFQRQIMGKKDLTKILINEIYSKAYKKNHSTNKSIVKHIDVTWSLDLLDLSDYGTKNNNGFGYIWL